MLFHAILLGLIHGYRPGSLSRSSSGRFRQNELALVSRCNRNRLHPLLHGTASLITEPLGTKAGRHHLLEFLGQVLTCHPPSSDMRTDFGSPTTAAHIEMILVSGLPARKLGSWPRPSHGLSRMSHGDKSQAKAGRKKGPQPEPDPDRTSIGDGLFVPTHAGIPQPRLQLFPCRLKRTRDTDEDRLPGSKPTGPACAMTRRHPQWPRYPTCRPHPWLREDRENDH